jgi:competence protein ComEC
VQSAPPGLWKSRGSRAGVLPSRLLGIDLHGADLHGVRLGLLLAEGRRRLLRAMALEAERRRLFLWLPVLMGVGILLYFTADREPALWAPLTGLTLAGGFALLLRNRRLAPAICLGIAAVFAGFAAASWRTTTIAAPVLERPRVGQLSGFVESIEARDAGARLVVLVTDIVGVEAQRQPRRVRVNIRAGSISPGDHISAVARLLPPPGPARPGGYDFGRDAFFRGIGAVGNIPGKISLTPPPHPPPFTLAIAVMIDRARNALTQRIASIGGGQAGAMAAALVTGKRGLITETTNTDLRAAGIYHIVSISGLHMVLAAGTIFWIVRALLALSLTLASHWPIKKLAALAAMAGATGYCIFSGSDVATVRSLIMTLVMLGAILVDRSALSMRNLALAAMIVLLREPDALLGPSFQMSFGAVAALIAFAERWENRDRPAPPTPLPWPIRPLWIAASGTVITTLLATAATAPFGAYHFQTFNPFGLLGNALALPFVSLFVMPAAVFGVLAYPFGLDWPAWWLMGFASDMVLRLAHWVATIDHSTLVVIAFGPAALGCFAASLLWITLWTTKLRWLAILPLATGVAVAAKPERPDILIERDGSGIAVRGADERLLVAGRPSRFVLQQWLIADGDSRSPDDATLRQGVICDQLGCVIRTKDGSSVAYARDRLAIIEDCRRADIVITPIPWTAGCNARLIERTALIRDGATSLFGQRGGWRSQSADLSATQRPWNRRRPEVAPLPPRPAPQSLPDDATDAAVEPLQ